MKFRIINWAKFDKDMGGFFQFDILPNLYFTISKDCNKCGKKNLVIGFAWLVWDVFIETKFKW